MIAIFDGRKKSKMKMSTNWYVAIEHWGSSSIEVIFVDYQTSKLQCNYQSYIQERTIGDAWSFSGIVLIVLSRGFSVETLIGVQLCHGRLSQRAVSLSQKLESLDCCTTAVQVYCKKDGYHRRQNFLDQMLTRSITMEMCFLDGWTWHMTTAQQ